VLDTVSSGYRAPMILDRLFAAGYDTIFQRAEAAGLREMRASAISDLSGTVVELGSGTGLNLAHYPPAVTRLIASEPDPHMVKRLRAKVAEGEGGTGRVTVVQAGAERLPLADGEADAVVSTLVLCTVPDVQGALREAVRVLRPGGLFRFVEHVRNADARSAAWQDRLNRPWGVLAGGCTRTGTRSRPCARRRDSRSARSATTGSPACRRSCGR
jgi:SAM-dependent methyltransferase